jgi:hypothetical protein
VTLPHIFLFQGYHTIRINTFGDSWEVIFLIFKKLERLCCHILYSYDLLMTWEISCGIVCVCVCARAVKDKW